MRVNPNVKKKKNHSNIEELQQEGKHQQDPHHHKMMKMKKTQKNCKSNGDSNKGQVGHKGKSKHKELSDPIVEEGSR